MDTTLTQEDIAVFGSDPATTKEKPGTTDYENGVEVRYTAPAKWWNWLWNALTGWFTAHKADNESMITEEENLLAEANITPSSANSHQIGQSFVDIAETHAEDYDEETIVEGGVEHFKNKPYVSGAVIVLPDTELL